MQVPVIRLIDLGYDDAFGKAMNFAQSLLSSINVSGHRADIEYIRTQDAALVARALTVPARLVHIMAHGMTTEDGDAGFASISDQGDVFQWLSLRDLAAYLQAGGEGIEATAIFADCCGSAQQRFKSALRNSLEQEAVFIGASRAVDWHECTTYASILYGSMLRAKGRGFLASDWVMRSAEMSVEAYETAVDGRCPFAVSVLTPSRMAKRAFEGSRKGRGLG